MLEQLKENSDLFIAPAKLDFVTQTLTKLQNDGPENLHILTDFDRTLTQNFVNGERVSSQVSVLRRLKIPSESYVTAAQELFDQFHPIETNPSLDRNFKKEKMTERRRAHLQLLVDHHISLKKIQQVIESEHLKFRPSTKKFLKILSQHDIPTIIFSSNVLGHNSIRLFLQKQNCNFHNLHIVSNTLQLDENGIVVGFQEPVIHVFNKDETILQNFDFAEKISQRKNIILLGDSEGDPGMVNGSQSENLLKIGFLNEEKSPNDLQKYSEIYDIVIRNDGDIDPAFKIIAEISKKSNS